MRILAIRGCNLASLAGEFEIDLAHGPLGDAGVFAIVGNTGAGKSTLLDALCVALFDRTPRLTNHSRVQVGRGDDDPGALGAQDVRTLLRRGAAQGWAEVDFESGDAKRYRARWSVRRARGNVGGTIQSQQVTLTSLDGGERLGGTKTETLQAIHARLGLSFDQFRRSALLAQGEFAAFLRADGKDRSELLERMTGTEIYSRLSVAAHLKAALAEQQLRDGRARAEAIPVLDADARAAAEAELQLAEQAKHAARERLASAQAAARWLAENTRREDMLRAAEAAHEAAVSELASADADRAEIALRRRAEALRPAWDEATRLDRQLSIARGEASAATEAASRAEAARVQIAERQAGLSALHEPIRNARIAAGLVERAGRTDAAEQLAHAATDDARWLVERVALAAEVAGWSELDARFAQHGQLADAIDALEHDLERHIRTQAQIARARETLVAEHRDAQARLADAQRKAEAFRKRRGLTLDQARRNEDEARIRLADAERLVAIAVSARTAATTCADLERQLAELDALAASDALAVKQAEAARGQAALVRSERMLTVDALRRAAGYEHARAELRDGETCPLCGATEHPWAGRGALDEAIAAAEARLAEAVAEHDAATAQIATLAARDQARATEHARLGTLRTAAEATATEAAAAWRAHLATLGELMLVADPATPEAAALAAEREAAARKRLEEARAARAQVEAAMKAVADAQAEVRACQATVDHLATERAALDRKLAELAAAIERTRGEQAGRKERHRELAAELDAAIARWKSTAAGGAPEAESGPCTPASSRAWIAELAAVWRSRAERVAAADAALVAALAAIEQAARQADTQLADTAARQAEAERRRDELATQHDAATERLAAARADAGFSADELVRLLSAEPSRLDALVDKLARLERTAERERAVVEERRRLVDDHRAHRPASLDDAAQVDTLAALVTEAEHHAAKLQATLAADDDARARRQHALDMLAAAEASAQVDAILGAVIGSHDGKKFRSFAQSLTLDGLLAVANAHLDELAPRYQLERVPKHDLELQVIDRDLGDEVRSVQSLSGGESFLVSLALALGLSSMSAHDVRVRTLLIDEGFGTLDPATLELALSVLEALRQQGRQVGVISHVPQLVERVGAHVRVVQRGGGRSEVIVA